MKKMVIMALLIISACSTQPKNPGDIYAARKQAETQLGMGNRQADRGNLDAAMIHLNEAMRLAITVDNPSLRIRAGLSRSNVLFSMGRREEAVAGWNQALDEAVRQGNTELAALCRIHSARGRLLSPGGKDAARAVRDEVSRDMTLFKSDRFYTAFAWTIIALAEKELGNYAPAEAASRRSLEIHEKDRFFELAAYDWFIIASCRSLAGNYRGAKQALESAIAFDRRVENSWGLASDWRAMGEIEKKAGNDDAARAAYTRAADIFRALGNESAAEDALSRGEEGK
jgi:tetratricopeptide (TPR) repeat protein